ncbi:hypothetical protein PIB19_06850 [Sphingomonas sp. 7/4-4]|uniref:hypothetical protein n=1 Tax=Sphingomonas sp. 7/4-4 TaxID=3018446 RepID=UPI0022F3BD26|nr:hypothetical protein [Sphingomonas sp. 7/4-4]WBY09076.1 hypothetical protein PIB19_06850 [Sphingomonas sp. 7/4-4]
MLLFARAVANRPDQVQLANLDGQRTYSPELDALVRGIVRETIAGDAPPAITGVGNAFHVPGSLPGEGETQVFLQTAGGAPVSLQILRRPGEQPRWSVSLGDIVDEIGRAAPAEHVALVPPRLRIAAPIAGGQHRIGRSRQCGSRTAGL